MTGWPEITNLINIQAVLHLFGFLAMWINKAWIIAEFLQGTNTNQMSRPPPRNVTSDMISQLVTSEGGGIEKAVEDLVCRTQRIPLQKVEINNLVQRWDFRDTKERVGDSVV